MLRALGLLGAVFLGGMQAARASDGVPGDAVQASSWRSGPDFDAYSNVILRDLNLAQAATASLDGTTTAPATPATPASAPPALAPSSPLPTLAALEAAGAVIGEIRINTQNVFDPEDPRESGILYRWANALHIKTRPNIIEHALLFQRGEKLSVKRIEETERLLRTNAFIYDVIIQPVAYRDGVVDIEVKTFDTWSLTAA